MTLRTRIRRSAILGSLLLTVLSASAHAAPTWRVLLGGDDDFTPHEPSGVALDPSGTIFIVDTSGSRIEKLSPTGQVMSTLGHVGTGDDAVRGRRQCGGPVCLPAAESDLVSDGRDDGHDQWGD